MRAHVVVETAQNCFAAIDEAGVDAEPVHDRRELDSDIAAAEDRDVFRQRLKLEDLVRGDRQFGALDPAGKGRRSASRNEDLPCRNRPAGLDQAKRMRIDKFRAVVDEVGPGVAQIACVDARQAIHLAMQPVHEGAVIVARVLDAPAISSHVIDAAAEFGGVDHVLLGDAAAHDAGAARPVLLRNPHLGAGHCNEPRGAHPAGSRADGEQVVVVCHGCSALRSGIAPCLRQQPPCEQRRAVRRAGYCDQGRAGWDLGGRRASKKAGPGVFPRPALIRRISPAAGDGRLECYSLASGQAAETPVAGSPAVSRAKV